MDRFDNSNKFTSAADLPFASNKISFPFLPTLRNSQPPRNSRVYPGELRVEISFSLSLSLSLSRVRVELDKNRDPTFRQIAPPACLANLPVSLFKILQKYRQKTLCNCNFLFEMLFPFDRGQCIFWRKLEVRFSHAKSFYVLLLV